MAQEFADGLRLVQHSWVAALSAWGAPLGRSEDSLNMFGNMRVDSLTTMPQDDNAPVYVGV